MSGMAQFASLTEQAKAAILIGDHDRLGELMNANFALRRELYGDGALGAQMLKLVSIAQSHGVPVKFPGSGGAVVGLRIADDVAMEAMRHDLERNGCVFVLLSPSPRALVSGLRRGQHARGRPRSRWGSALVLYRIPT